MDPTFTERSGIVRALEILREETATNVAKEGGLVGIGIRFRPTEYNFYVVAGLTQGGPADEAGVEEGDIIHYVDGVAAKNLSTDELIRKIQGKPGTVLTLSVEASRTAGSLRTSSHQSARTASTRDGKGRLSPTGPARDGASLPSPRKYDLNVTRRQNLVLYSQGYTSFDLGFVFAKAPDGSIALDATAEGSPARELIKRGKTALGHSLLCIDHQSISGYDVDYVHLRLQGPPGSNVTLTMEATGTYAATSSDVQELNRSVYSSRGESSLFASWPSSRQSSPERAYHNAGQPCVKVCVIDASGIPRASGEAPRRYFCCVSVLRLRRLESSSVDQMGDEAVLAGAVAHSGRSSDHDAGGERRLIRPQRRTKGVVAAPGAEWERLLSFYEAAVVVVQGGRPVSADEVTGEEAEELKGQRVQLLLSVHEQERGGRGQCLGQAVLGLAMGSIEDRWHLPRAPPPARSARPAVTGARRRAGGWSCGGAGRAGRRGRGQGWCCT